MFRFEGFAVNDESDRRPARELITHDATAPQQTCWHTRATALFRIEGASGNKEQSACHHQESRIARSHAFNTRDLGKRKDSVRPPDGIPDRETIQRYRRQWVGLQDLIAEEVPDVGICHTFP